MRRETELYEPIRDFLAAQGYEVRGEVRGCDVVGMRGEELVVVELKPAMNLTLVLQGIERLKLTDAVYLAIEEPKRRERRHWYAAQGLCRRLGLGLITVRFGCADPRVEVLCDPGPYKPRQSARGRRQLLGEFQRRTGDHNPGGSTRRQVVTAYREEALRLASELERRGAAKVKELRDATGCEKAGAILRDNFYGWFERLERGVYRLTDAGRAALREYGHILSAQRQACLSKELE